MASFLMMRYTGMRYIYSTLIIFVYLFSTVPKSQHKYESLFLFFDAIFGFISQKPSKEDDDSLSRKLELAEKIYPKDYKKPGGY